MSEPQLLSHEAYKQHVTGAPQGLHYVVEEPVTKTSYPFDGFAEGHLIWTIADHATKLGPDAADDLEDAYLEQAQLQRAVRQGYPIMWCVQQSVDVGPLQQILDQMRITDIVIRHTPVTPR